MKNSIWWFLFIFLLRTLTKWTNVHTNKLTRKRKWRRVKEENERPFDFKKLNNLWLWFHVISRSFHKHACSFSYQRTYWSLIFSVCASYLSDAFVHQWIEHRWQLRAENCDSSHAFSFSMRVSFVGSLRETFNRRVPTMPSTACVKLSGGNKASTRRSINLLVTLLPCTFCALKRFHLIWRLFNNKNNKTSFAFVLF